MAHRLAPVVCLAFCTCGFAQTPPAASQSASAQVKVGAQANAAKPSPAHTAAKPPSPAPATSLLNNPAQPAKVTLAAGELTVLADNSSLSEILHQVAAASGMKVEGLQAGTSGGQRVFGMYGPGAPREVLSELLNGSGYNVMMLGETSSGAPRELMLMARAGAVANASPPSIVPNENNEKQDQPEEAPTEHYGQPEMPPGPGVGNGLRTPEQVQQELQKLREQREQQPQQDQQDQQPDQPDQPDQPN